jgi:hypothetical protein
MRRQNVIVRQAALETRRPLPLDVVLGWHQDQFEHGERPFHGGMLSRCARRAGVLHTPAEALDGRTRWQADVASAASRVTGRCAVAVRPWSTSRLRVLRRG